MPELTIKPPKGVVHKLTFNPRARAAQHYNIVEDLAQSPSAMSTLEVLQNCPSQRQALLSAIGGLILRIPILCPLITKGMTLSY